MPAEFRPAALSGCGRSLFLFQSSHPRSHVLPGAVAERCGRVSCSCFAMSRRIACNSYTQCNLTDRPDARRRSKWEAKPGLQLKTIARWGNAPSCDTCGQGYWRIRPAGMPLPQTKQQTAQVNKWEHHRVSMTACAVAISTERASTCPGTHLKSCVLRHVLRRLLLPREPLEEIRVLFLQHRAEVPQCRQLHGRQVLLRPQPHLPGVRACPLSGHDQVGASVGI